MRLMRMFVSVTTTQTPEEPGSDCPLLCGVSNTAAYWTRNAVIDLSLMFLQLAMRWQQLSGIRLQLDGVSGYPSLRLSKGSRNRRKFYGYSRYPLAWNRPARDRVAPAERRLPRKAIPDARVALQTRRQLASALLQPSTLVHGGKEPAIRLVRIAWPARANPPPCADSLAAARLWRE